MSFRFVIFTFIVLGVTSAQLGSADLSFTNYDEPLYEQIKSRIKEKIITIVGKGSVKKDRYFLVSFSYQDADNTAKESHTFATLLRMRSKATDSSLNDGYVDEDRRIQAFTISWLPKRFKYNDRSLCVFKGFGSHVFPRLNQCRPETGYNFTLKETLEFAMRPEIDEQDSRGNIQPFTRLVGMWGPFEINEKFYKKGVERKKYLESGISKYIADDRLYRKSYAAFNCYHATTDLQVGFSEGGFLGTGFKMWGLNGSRHNLKEYLAKVSEWFVHPMSKHQIDEKLFGYVYSEKLKTENVQAPFVNAAAFYK